MAVTEHRLHRRRCPDCGKATRAELPADVPVGAFGPRLEAAVATLAVRNRVSRRDTVELAGELFGAGLASGTVDAILARAGEALAGPYEDLLARIRKAPALNVDETGWKLRGKKRTLWGAVTSRAAVFRIAPDRHEHEVARLLGGEFAGIVGSDRWWAYRGFDPERRQACWSHLIRDLTAHSEGLAAQKCFGEAGLNIARRLFAAWEDFHEHGDRRRLKRETAPLKREFKALLKRGSKGRRNKLTWGFSKNLLKIWPALWTFVEVEGVEPTNNRAERALRGPVIYRKLSLGSQSERGRPPSSGCSLPRSPVACRAARCLPTWPGCSTPGFVGIQLRCWPDPRFPCRPSSPTVPTSRRQLNAYGIRKRARQGSNRWPSVSYTDARHAVSESWNRFRYQVWYHAASRT